MADFFGDNWDHLDGGWRPVPMTRDTLAGEIDLLLGPTGEVWNDSPL